MKKHIKSSLNNRSFSATRYKQKSFSVTIPDQARSVKELFTMWKLNNPLPALSVYDIFDDMDVDSVFTDYFDPEVNLDIVTQYNALSDFSKREFLKKVQNIKKTDVSNVISDDVPDCSPNTEHVSD